MKKAAENGKKNGSSKKSGPEDLYNFETSGEDFLIVGIGASAGGVRALREFLQYVPRDSGSAYVMILHLSPDYDSKLAEILQNSAPIPVRQVK
jgi:chemotaxis response regulator CheB